MPSWAFLVSVLVASCAVVLYADEIALSRLADLTTIWTQRPLQYISGFLTKPDDDWDVLHHQGGNSPWFRKTDGLVDDIIEPPDDCRVEQVHMISRHAERYPTFLSGSRMLDLYNRIHRDNVTLEGDLAFAMTWPFLTPDPDPPDVFLENLVSTGAHAGTLQAFKTGVKLRGRYRDLLDQSSEAASSETVAATAEHPTSFWSSDAPRVVETARYFAAGFFGVEWEKPTSQSTAPRSNARSRSSYPAQLNIIPTDPSRGADTLTPGKNCPNYYDRTSPNNSAPATGRARAYEALAEFRTHFLPPIIARLEKQNPHFRLSDDEVYSMFELCGFDTIASASTGDSWEDGWVSPWCGVFTRREWEAFEYARDVLHYYRSGPGNAFSQVLGRGWVNATTELLRAGPDKGRIFMSLAHDTDLLATLTSLNLISKHPMPTAVSTPPEQRTFHSSSFLPMHGRLLIERLACPVPRYCWSNAPFYPNHVYCSDAKDEYFVRLNVNDGIVGMPGCAGGPGGSCPLAEFVRRVEESHEGTGSFGDICGLEEGTPEKVTFLRQG